MYLNGFSLKSFASSITKPVVETVKKVADDPVRQILAASTYGQSEAYYRNDTVRDLTKEYGILAAATTATIVTGGAAAPALVAAGSQVLANEQAKREAEKVAAAQAEQVKAEQAKAESEAALRDLLTSGQRFSDSTGWAINPTQAGLMVLGSVAFAVLAYKLWKGSKK